MTVTPHDPGHTLPGKPPHVPNPDAAEFEPGVHILPPADPNEWEGKHLVVNCMTGGVTAHDTPEAAADQAAANDRWGVQQEAAKKNQPT